MNSTQYLDAAKKALGIQSDYALAKHVGLTHQAIYKLRHGEVVMSNTTAARIAEILGVPELRVIADCELERGSNDQLWKRIRDAAVIAVVMIGVASFGVLVSPQPAQAGEVLQRSLCKIRKGLPAWLRWLL